MPSLQQLRESQRAAGLAPDVYTPRTTREIDNVQGGFSLNVPEVDDSFQVMPPDSDPVAELPKVRVQQIQTPARGLRGYTRILPPGKRSVAELTGDWIIEFWDTPSPWCSIEGEPVHPEFEANLKSFEGAA